MNNPHGKGSDGEGEARIAAYEAAERSGQKAAETNERSRQILNYYRRRK